MELLKELIIVSEKAANVARLCRQNEHLFRLLIQKKSCSEANPRFVEDFKTLADVLIQQMVKHDIGRKFPAITDSILGEENNSFCNKLGETISVEIKKSPAETASLLQKVLNDDSRAAELLSAEVHKEVFLDDVNTKKPRLDFTLDFQDLGVWIDPIDSTAEYINGVEEIDASGGISISGLKCVTVLIGVYDKKTGVPVVGVVNQPFVKNDGHLWRGECFWAQPSETSLPPSPLSSRLVCVSSSENQEVITKLKTGFQIVEASGAGYKILTVITGLTDAYVLTKDSTFKWDTCAPQSVLRALGGDIVTFNSIIDGDRKSVTYSNGSNCNRGGIIAFKDEQVLEEIVKCLA